MVVKWIVCFWCCPAGCILMFFCFVTYALSYFGSTAHCRLKLNFFFFAHSSDKLPAVNLLPKPRARKPLKVQDLSLLTSCVVLCLCPKANTLSSIFFFSRTHLSQSHCMCSVVVVEAMVASTVTSGQPGHDNLFFFFFLLLKLHFPKQSTWLCDLMGTPMITGSQTVPLNFIQS